MCLSPCNDSLFYIRMIFIVILNRCPKLAHTLIAYVGLWPADQVLTLDIGDHMDRMRPETEGTNASANLEIMNATGYEAMVMGNNEGLTFTPELLRTVVKEHAKFPIIGSNIVEVATNKTPDWMLSTLTIEKSGLQHWNHWGNSCLPSVL